MKHLPKKQTVRDFNVNENEVLTRNEMWRMKGGEGPVNTGGDGDEPPVEGGI